MTITALLRSRVPREVACTVLKTSERSDSLIEFNSTGS